MFGYKEPITLLIILSVSLEIQCDLMKEPLTGVQNRGTCLRCYPRYFYILFMFKCIISTYVCGTTLIVKWLRFNGMIICKFSKSVKVN